MECFFKKYTLHFKKPGGTSRGVLRDKDTFFIFLKDKNKIAIGECNRFAGLSFDDWEGFEQQLKKVCLLLPNQMEEMLAELTNWPAIRFGVETLLKDWENGGCRIIFPESMPESGFTVPINGLIWMGPEEEMKKQIILKLRAGYTSIKLKIGAIDFQSELDLLKYIRKQFTSEEVEIRVDANGAFTFGEAKEKLEKIAPYEISYIEQPIKAGRWQEMAALCETTPIKIALDEELIGIIDSAQKEKLIETIKPQLLVLKPALVGGFSESDTWKKLIRKAGGDWVITSALESNIGLNAIAQYAAKDSSGYAQGLGTGQLYTNNIPSPFTVDAQGLHYHKNKGWDFSFIL